MAYSILSGVSIRISAPENIRCTAGWNIYGHKSTIGNSRLTLQKYKIARNPARIYSVSVGSPPSFFFDWLENTTMPMTTGMPMMTKVVNTINKFA